MYIIRDQINEISIFISLIRYLESELSSFAKNGNSFESNYADILNSNMLKMQCVNITSLRFYPTHSYRWFRSKVEFQTENLGSEKIFVIVTNHWSFSLLLESCPQNWLSLLRQRYLTLGSQLAASSLHLMWLHQLSASPLEVPVKNPRWVWN